jgi:hypothetical protein
MVRTSAAVAALLLAMVLGAAGCSGSRQAKDPSADDQALSLLQPSGLTYTGAFRVPCGSPCVDVNAFDYGGYCAAFNPDGDSGAGTLLLCGKLESGKIGELSIPPPVSAASAATLPTARLLSPGTLIDPSGGHRGQITGGDGVSNYIGGLLLANRQLISDYYVYYDGAGSASLSHFVGNGTTYAYQGGPYQVGSMGAGWVAGPMVAVPESLQDSLGGPYLTGQCCLAVTGRSSQGPSMSVFDPLSLGMFAVPAWLVLGYPDQTANSHTTLGAWASSGGLYNGATAYPAAVVVGRTLLFGGRLSKGSFCYGNGTGDASLGGRPVPGEPGVVYCYDPTDSGKGPHAYPYDDELVAYDLNDLVAVKAGKMQSWEVQPYAHWALTFPLGPAQLGINAMAYDPATSRLFVVQRFGDGTRPLVHVYTVSTGG